MVRKVSSLSIGIMSLVSFYIFSIQGGYAQSSPGSLNFAYSYCCFAGAEGVPSVEFSYRFSENGLTYRNGFGRLMIELQMYDTSGLLRESFLWTVDHVTGEDGPSGRVFVGLERFEATSDRYDVTMKLTDALNISRSDSITFPLELRYFTADRIGLSDIELITEMAPAGDSDHPFVRGDYILMRNVDGIVGPPDHRLNSYVEIYHADKIAASECHLVWLIADTNGRGVYMRDTLLSRPDTSVIFDVNSVVLNGLKSGRYILAARLFNARRGLASDSVQIVRGFEVWNPKMDSLTDRRQEILAEREDLIDPTYGGMKEKELDAEYTVTEYIMNQTKRNVWKELSGVEPKARFLTKFWLALDDDPSTPENPFREDYFRRVDIAKKLYYSSLTPKGWDSDRGRILLTYGQPDVVDRHPSDHNRKPYEIWTYTSNRIDFVFVDLSQNGTYSLVHSTAQNEIRYPEWERDYAALHEQMYEGEFDRNNRSGF